MKKLLLSSALLALFAAAPVQRVAAQSYDASASTEIFDFSPFSDEAMLNLFYDALQQGRNYPTTAEFEAAGFNMTDVEFVRSHVRRAALLDDQAGQLRSNVKNTRRVWMNIPMGSAKIIGGYPGTNPGDDTYSLWNYTHLFGSWNHGIFQAPGAWIDAAHQNGTDMMSGIKFFESWTAGSQPTGWQKIITTKETDGSFRYVKPLINCLRYFGSDGINYNWEASGYDEEDVVAFHKALYKEAAAQGFDSFHIGLYTQRNSLVASYANAMFGNSETGKTTDLMLNYSNGDFTGTYQMRSSITAANNAMGTSDGLYAGVWIVTMNRSWTNLSGNDIGACLWGEHASSRFWSYNVGNDAQNFQANYQAMLERAFSGGNRNPANLPTMSNSGNEYGWTNNGTTPPLSKFGGLATYFPERTAIQGSLPFHTYFNIGTGDIYNYHGKQTHGNWYNLSTQDVVPTYRWLVYNAGTTTVSTAIQPEYSIEDAWNGGSCLKLAGTPSASGTDIVLFRTRLTGTSGQPFAKIAVKTGQEGENETGLYVIVKTGGAWKEYPVGKVEGTAWQEKTIELSGLSSSDQIDFIGLRVKGDGGAYKILVGELQINDEATTQPTPIKDNLTAEVKRETTNMFSVKLNWELDATVPASGLLYNDDANIHHFEVLYKNGESGRISVVSHVQGWSAFVGNKVLAEDEDPWFGVRAVSTDLKTYGEPVWRHVVRSTNVPAGTAEGDLLYPGESVINVAAAGFQTAVQYRYLTSVTTTGATTQDLNYVGTRDMDYPEPQDNDNYIDAHQTAVLKVKQGDVIQFNYVMNTNSDGLQWCVMKAYADWNMNGYFEGGTDELLVEQGTANTNNSIENTPERSTSPLHGNGYSSSPLVPFSFKVPDDAVCGKGRIRIVFTDAWEPHPGPIGLTAKGYTLDLGIEITGDNPQRVAVVTRDQGVADEPEGLGELTAIRTVESGAASSATFNGTAITLTSVEQVWLYTADGRLVKYAAGNPTSLATRGLAPGVYIVKMQADGVIRSQKVVIK
ncbi:MAG: T9SS type A sorting domain-containing protein [Bacteroidaceae bacterium]|nr:T9SS type A sorting domain-containing protein [Bacteroidaceae bacterium]